ncbi:MAG TPA: 4'-phosphopantetheinyl transferase superfamily protein [Acidobacteriaceae bacterium]|jgi:4'-phosphopantetheinyl transferase
MASTASEALVAALERVLATEEAERASRFRFSHLRESYITTHGILRCLLGRYLDLDPAGICFVYSARGKPALDSAGGLQFNLTHSDSMAAIALTTGCPLGIDMEHTRPLADIEQIAGQYFCPEETAEILSLPLGERERAFFSCWTRKEAYIKAIGDGLSCGLDSFRVSVQPDAPARLIHIGGDTVAPGSWSLHNLSLAPDYAAALAYQDRPRTISIFPLHNLSEFL